VGKHEDKVNILINTFGTRGDIQPFIALALGLQSAGHRVALGTSAGYGDFVTGYGVSHIAMDNTLLEMAQASMDDVPGMRDAMRMLKQMNGAMRQMMQDEWQATQTFGPDMIIYHPKCLGSLHIADKLGIPAILSLPLPLYTPTRAFAAPLVGAVPFGSLFNRTTYVMHRAQSAMMAGLVNSFRQQTLGLSAQGRFASVLKRGNGDPVPVLYPFSPFVIPVPDDYPAHVHVTGYWFLPDDNDWQPDPALTAFLDAGPAPVYVGFGSMAFKKDIAARTQSILSALAATAQRAILARGWGGLSAADLPENVMMIDAVPHDWLFPRMSAVIHHGGAGTTAAGLRAGKPTLICPFIADQPFWGKVVHDLGVGPAPISVKKLTVDSMTAALREMTGNPAMRHKAEAVGAKIRAEDGVANAVAVIERIGAGERQRVLA
jgi:sterol 3beta-glucosyltransferase